LPAALALAEAPGGVGLLDSLLVFLRHRALLVHPLPGAGGAVAVDPAIRFASGDRARPQVLLGIRLRGATRLLPSAAIPGPDGPRAL
jgi:hypothetical protein